MITFIPEFSNSRSEFKRFWVKALNSDIATIQKIKKEPIEVPSAHFNFSEKNFFCFCDFSISQSQASDILDEISGSLKKLDHKVSLKKRDGKEATVEVSSQYIEYRDLFKKASDETVNELKSRHVEELSGAKDLLVENIKDSFQNAEASKDMHSVTFQLKCEKIKSGENKVYIFFPEDAEETGAQLMKLVTNK